MLQGIGFDVCINGLNTKDEASSFEIRPLTIFCEIYNFVKNHRKSQFHYLEKDVFKLCPVMIKKGYIN